MLLPPSTTTTERPPPLYSYWTIILLQLLEIELSASPVAQSSSGPEEGYLSKELGTAKGLLELLANPYPEHRVRQLGKSGYTPDT